MNLKIALGRDKDSTAIPLAVSYCRNNYERFVKVAFLRFYVMFINEK